MREIDVSLIEKAVEELFISANAELPKSLECLIKASKDAETNEVLFEGNFTAPKNSSTRLTKLPIYFSEHRMLIFEWEANGERGINHYLCGYPPFSLEKYVSLIKKHEL